MSVINQVLNDIEQRSKSEQAIGADKFSTLELQEPRANTKVLLALTVLVGVLLTAGWLFYHQQSNIAAEQAMSEGSASLAKAISMAAVNSSTDLTDIDIEPDAKLDTQDTQTASVPPKLVRKKAVPQKSVASTASDNLAQINSSNKAAVAKQGNSAAVIAMAVKAKSAVEPLTSNDSGLAAQAPAPVITKVPGPEVVATKSQADSTGELRIQTVELTPLELAALKVKQGDNQLDRGYLFKAQDLWRESLDIVPSHHLARERLVRSYLDSNSIEPALALLLEGVKLFPSHWQYQLMAAQIYVLNQQLEQALAVLDRPYRFSDKSDDVLALAASVAQQLQRWQLAELNYVRLVARNKTNQQWLMGLAISLDAQAKTQSAIRRYSELILLPNTSAVLANYAKERITLLQGQQQRDNNG